MRFGYQCGKPEQDGGHSQMFVYEGPRCENYQELHNRAPGLEIEETGHKEINSNPRESES